MKLKVGDILAWNSKLYFWKVIRVYEQDKCNAEVKIIALGSNHPCYKPGQVIRWTADKSHIRVIPKLRYELLRYEE